MKIQLITPNGRGKALGAGCDPEVGQKAALDCTDRILEVLEGADMVFIAAGMGGGTGTGAGAGRGQPRPRGRAPSPWPSSPSRSRFEGTRKARIAEKGIEELRKCVDTLITVPNARLLQMVGPDITVENAFHLADEVLRHGVQGISDIINETGIINPRLRGRRDGDARRRHGADGHRRRPTASTARSRRRSTPSPRRCSRRPSLDGAQRVLVNFVGGPDITLAEINDAAEYIASRCAPDCLFIPGYAQRDSFEGQIQVTVVATGFGATAERSARRPAPPSARPSGPSRRVEPVARAPASTRRPSTCRRTSPRTTASTSSDFSEFETPTYLRRQMD